MGLRDNLRAVDRALSDYARGQRMLTPAQFWGSGNEFKMPGRTAAGENVTIETALALPVVLRAFSLMVGDIGPLPIDTFRRSGTRRIEMDPPGWLEVPDPSNLNFGRPQLIGQLVASLMGDGNLYLRAFPDRFAPSFVRVLDPWRWRVETDADGVDWYRSGATRLGSNQVVHVPMLTLPGQSAGKSPISLLSEPIASGLAAIRFGGYFFSNGAAMQGIIEAPAGAQVDPAQIKREMERGNRGLSRSHALGVLTGGATFKQLTANPRDSQMVELQQYIVEDVGRAFGIPPYLLGSQEPGAVAYASTSNARIDYVQHGVQPVVTRLEHALSTLIPGADTFLRFNLSALLRGDQAARYTAYHTLLQDAVITRDEVRAWEDWGPADEASGVDTEYGTYLATPNNTAPGDQAPSAPMPEGDAVRILATALATRAMESDDVPQSIHVHQPDMERVTEQVAELVRVLGERAEAAELRAVAAEQRIAELVARPPVVNVEAPVVNVSPADVTVNVPEQAAPQVRVDVPAVQRVQIVGLPSMRAQIKRDRSGRIESIEDVTGG